MERDELVYFKHFWEHILQKQMFEIEQRYFNRIPLATDLYDELRIKFENKNVIPFMDFSVAQRCSLNCRACTQWMPYLRNRKIFSGKEVNDWLEKIFKWIDYVHIISPFGGEAFLNPDFGDILEEMLSYQKKGKIGFIRIVTNGTIYPNKKLQEVLCNPNILILVSNYEDKLGRKQAKNYNEFISFLENNKCNYYEATMQWIDLGEPKKNSTLSEGERKLRFKNCFIQDCVGIYEGNLYHCPRIYALENIGELKTDGDEVIRFGEINSWDEMRVKLERFYRVEDCLACEWCNAPEERGSIPAAEQI